MALTDPLALLRGPLGPLVLPRPWLLSAARATAQLPGSRGSEQAPTQPWLLAHTGSGPETELLERVEAGAWGRADPSCFQLPRGWLCWLCPQGQLREKGPARASPCCLPTDLPQAERGFIGPRARPCQATLPLTASAWSLARWLCCVVTQFAWS